VDPEENETGPYLQNAQLAVTEADVVAAVGAILLSVGSASNAFIDGIVDHRMTKNLTRKRSCKVSDDKSRC
jgi:hypothetical protein